MHAFAVIIYIIFALATVGQAEPIQIRDDLSSVLASVTSVAESAATAEASAISVGAQQALSDASTWLTAHSGVFTAATCTCIVTSVGGPAITLAVSGGVVTTFAGTQYTVMIASATSTTNAAMNVHSITLTAPPVLTALVTVVGGTLLGAWLTW